MQPLPFQALWTVEPWGVMVFDATNGLRLWRGRDWLRHRGGLVVHYSDLSAGRTTFVDHLEFVPGKSPGLDHDTTGRSIARVSLGMAFGIAVSRDEGVDERYLGRCFNRDDARRILNALHGIACLISHSPLPSGLTAADLAAATVHRVDGMVMIQ